MFFSILLYSTIALLFFYGLLMLFYAKWYKKVNVFLPNKDVIPQTLFSIIIPARNEDENIGKCLHSIYQQNYPTSLFEVIVVDDYSTDDTANIVLKLTNEFKNLRLISLEKELSGKKLNAYKKKAIDIAIAQSNGTWIITTDADCLMQQSWLYNFDNYVQQNNVQMVAAPVCFINVKTVLSNFQYIDFMALQAATVASVSAGVHSMCNGANLAYNKETFYKVGGFKGIDNIASGDDMLLMNKIKSQFKNSIGYLYNKQSIVYTQPMPTWKSFINQRIRWASKADKYDDKSLLPVLVLMYWFNLNILLFICFSFFSIKTFYITCCLILFKALIEWLLMYQASKFFGKLNFLKFLLLQPLHILYIIVAGWLGKFGTYKWKERKVS
jgi:cellulose synthase/poly-beta-1,6-N-acetylglucosamine synthase-like glycosyltransferase